jgi:hypothetical protein
VVVVPPCLVPHITTNKQTTSSNSFPSSSFRLPSHSVCWVTEWLTIVQFLFLFSFNKSFWFCVFVVVVVVVVVVGF